MNSELKIGLWNLVRFIKDNENEHAAEIALLLTAFVTFEKIAYVFSKFFHNDQHVFNKLILGLQEKCGVIFAAEIERLVKENQLPCFGRILTIQTIELAKLQLLISGACWHKFYSQVPVR